MSKPDEQVMVIPSRELDLSFHGFSQKPQHMPPLDKAEFRPRSEMEEDPKFKQLIPYLLVHHVGSDGTISVLSYRRGESGGESRLHAMRSIGIGGHISEEDAAGNDGSPESAYATGARRELTEEVSIGGEIRERRIGVIYDPSNRVGHVHLGVVHILLVETQDVEPREACMEGLTFLPVSRVAGQVMQYESWSQLLILDLYGKGLIRDELEQLRAAKV